ncbi:uncharacterized protein LOC144352820 [Saccoglossus kowalevskii]
MDSRNGYCLSFALMVILAAGWVDGAPKKTTLSEDHGGGNHILCGANFFYAVVDECARGSRIIDILVLAMPKGQTSEYCKRRNHRRRMILDLAHRCCNPGCNVNELRDVCHLLDM